MEPKKVVLMVFYDPKTQKVLSEKRPADHPHYPNQTTFPTGTVDQADNGNVKATLKREAYEELGITPKEFTSLASSPIYVEKANVLLFPFMITKWEGAFPKTILDKGNKLVWETLDEVSKSPIITRPKIVALIKEYISRHAEFISGSIN